MIDDIFILRLIKSGDKQIFKYLFELHFVPLCRFVRLYVKESRIAEEIVLDVFTTIWEKREELEIRITLKAYLFQAARNRALNYIRDNERFIPVSDWSAFERFETDDSLETKELERLIRAAVCSLPDRCREVFQKSRSEYLSNKEIAEDLHVSVKNGKHSIAFLLC